MSTDISDCRSLSESYASIAPSINTNPHYVSSSQIRKNKENRCFANVECPLGISVRSDACVMNVEQELSKGMVVFCRRQRFFF